jgi:hypothetical protein
MDRNILLGIVVILVFIIGYKLYNRNKLPENYGEVIKSEFSISTDNNKTIYEKYLEYIVYLIPDISKNKNPTVTKVQNNVYEYLSSIVYAPSMYPSPSASPMLSTPSSYPMDINLGYIFLAFFIVCILLFMIIKYETIIGAIKWTIGKISSRFSSKNSSSDSTLLSSDGSSESSSSSG